MTTLHFERALTPEGWASNVRVRIDGAAIASIERDAARAARRRALRDRRSGDRQPALARLPARHGGARRTARRVRTTASGPGATPCTGSRSRRPPTTSRRSRLRPMSRCSRPASAPSPSSTISTTTPSGAPYANRAEMAERDRRRRGRDRHRTDAAAGVLRARGLRRRARAARAAPLRQRSRLLRRAPRRLPRACEARRSSASRRTRCAPRPRRNSRPSSRSPATRRSTSMSPSRPERSRPASPGPARVRCDGSSITPQVERALVPRPRDACRRGRGAGARAVGRGRGPLPDHRGQPRRRRVSGARLSRRGRTVRRRLGFQRRDRGRGRIAACWNTRSALPRAPATSARRAAARPGAALFDGAAAGGAQALGRPRRHARARRAGRHRIA